MNPHRRPFFFLFSKKKKGRWTVVTRPFKILVQKIFFGDEYPLFQKVALTSRNTALEKLLGIRLVSDNLLYLSIWVITPTKFETFELKHTPNSQRRRWLKTMIP